VYVIRPLFFPDPNSEEWLSASLSVCLSRDGPAAFCYDDADNQPFLGVKELAVAAFGLLQSPAGGFEHLDQISDFQHSHDTVLAASPTVSGLTCPSGLP